MIRKALYYGFFFTVSLVINWVLFGPLPFAAEKEEDQEKAEAGGGAPDRVAVQLAPPKPAGAEAAPEPAPDPVEDEKKKELEEKIAQHMEMFKALNLKMAEMEEVLQEKEQQLAAQKAHQEELERQVTASREEKDEAAAAERAELEKRLAEAESRAEEREERLAEREERLKEEMARQMDEQLAAQAARAEAEKEDLAARSEELEKKLAEALAAGQATADAEKERLEEQLARQGREIERIKAASGARDRELEKQLAEQARQVEAERRAAASRERTLQEQLAAERQARAATERRREADLAELKERIDASRRAETAGAAPTRTSHQAASVTSMEEYVEFLRPYLSQEIRKEGVPLPIPGFDLSGTPELLDLIAYYSFTLVAYPEDEAKRSYFIQVDFDGSGRKTFARKDNFKALFNRMVLRLDGIDYFERIKDEVNRQQQLVDPGSGRLSIAFVTPEDRARYLRWKALRVCQDNGQAPADVFQCVGLFRKTRFGAWVFLIDHLVLDSGELVRVTDFEAGKVFGS